MEAEQATLKAEEERVALDSAVNRLRQEQASLHAVIAEEQKVVRKEIRTVATLVRDAATQMRQEAGKGVNEAMLEVHKLRDQALELGQELGHFEATIEANQWLKTLVALVKGDSGISAADVRVVGLAVLRGVKGWMEQNRSQISVPFSLTTWLGSVIGEFEQWKT
jgi:predicted  nucleic acid-binding Zn-ribbon protein